MIIWQVRVLNCFRSFFGRIKDIMKNYGRVILTKNLDKNQWQLKLHDIYMKVSLGTFSDYLDKDKVNLKSYH